MAHKYRMLIIFVLLCLANIYSTKIPGLGLLISILEYLVTYYLLLNKRPVDSFISYLVFTSVSLEMDAYIYLDRAAPFLRYHYLSLPFLGESLYALTILLICMSLYNSSVLANKTLGTKFLRWIGLLGVTGILSIIFGMLLNDNNIMQTGLYPKTAFSYFFKYIAFCCFFLSAFCIASSSDGWNKLSDYCQSILLSVSIASIISVTLGFSGYYGLEDRMMLAPLCVAFCPCILLWGVNSSLYGKLNAVTAIILVIVALGHPVVVGSKWYLILVATLLYYIFVQTNVIKNTGNAIFITVLIIIVLPVILGLVSSYVAQDDFNNWKFQQAMGMIDIFGYNSFMDWFMNLDTSAKFRIDEPINIAIEYMNKPYFALFGKGFAGTTLHHTIFCDWTTGSSFSDEQVLNNIYHSMHESTAVLFLRHGILGICFMFVTIKSLFSKTLIKTPWLIVALLWFIFYWSFGISFRIGAVALILTLTQSKDRLWQE